jgi:glycosyltransferase involved in cell wall biosynthesis
MSEYKNKSIAFVINSLEGGGAERVMCNLLRTMQSTFNENNCKVYLVLLDKLPEQQQCPDYVKKVTLNSRCKLVASYFHFNQWVKLNQPDLLVSFLTRSNIVTTLIGKRNNISTIISERVNTSSHFATARTGVISKIMVKTVYPKATFVVPVSQGVMRDLVQNYAVPQSKCTVMYNAYDQAVLSEKAAQIVTDLPAKPYLIGIGRLMTNKNFSLLINAFAKSKSQRDLVILGQGPELPVLTNLVKSLGLEKRVHLLGFKENPYPYLKNADFLVSTSNAEGFPNGIAEAMCLGKPVIATNCQSGPAEILTGDDNTQTTNYINAEHGILCEVNNENAVSQAINNMEANDQIEFYRQSSLARAMSFSYEAMQTTFIDLIQKAFGKSSKF